MSKNFSLPRSTEEAIDLQRILAEKVLNIPLDLAKIRTIAAGDISSGMGQDLLFVSVQLFDFPELQLLQEKTAVVRAAFPYRTGLLSFRELPALLPLFCALRPKPDAILVDGQGIAHPRRLGLASHLGVLLDRPTIGCAKSRLIGRFERLPRRKGEWYPLYEGDELVGAVVCTRTGVKPLFVSPGHRADVESAVRLALQTVSTFRIPEPLRQVHLSANRLRRSFFGEEGRI